MNFIEVIEEHRPFPRESTSEPAATRARFPRMLDGFRGDGSLSEGVKLPNGGKLKIGFHKHGGDIGANGNSVDNRILSMPASRSRIRKPGDHGLQGYQPAHQGHALASCRQKIMRRTACSSPIFTGMVHR